mgnify:CR=1 FL=1
MHVDVDPCTERAVITRRIDCLLSGLVVSGAMYRIRSERFLREDPGEAVRQRGS